MRWRKICRQVCRHERSGCRPAPGRSQAGRAPSGGSDRRERGGPHLTARTRVFVGILLVYALGVGVLLVLAGLAGARMIAALVAVTAGIVAAVVAIEPEVIDRDLAIERGWAIALAVGGLPLAALRVVSRERRHARRAEHHEARAA